MNLSEVLNSVNYNKEDIFQDLPDVTEKEYVPFVVNKCLSYFPDTIIQANNMNMHHGIDPKMQRVDQAGRPRYLLEGEGKVIL